MPAASNAVPTMQCWQRSVRDSRAQSLSAQCRLPTTTQCQQSRVNGAVSNIHGRKASPLNANCQQRRSANNAVSTAQRCILGAYSLSS
eukprot:7296785-Pyramimonas_sp.AAC.1